MVSGIVHLRPARVGLVAAEFDAETLRCAADIACSSWGGVFYPMLRASDPNLLRTIERLSLDFLHPIDESDLAGELAQRDGLHWRSGSPYGPFDPPDPGLRTGLLPTEEAASTSTQAATMATWPAEHPLADLFHVWFGRHRHGPACEAAPVPFCSDAPSMEVAGSAEVVELLERVVPIAATAAGLTYTGSHPGACVVVVGNDPEDLRSLWNLRAIGARVFPWPLHETGSQFREALAAWLRHPSTREDAGTWRSGDGTREGRHISIIAPREDDPFDALAVVLQEHGFTAVRRHDPTDDADSWTGYHPVQSDYEQSFSVQVDRNDWQFVVPVPPMIQRRRDTFGVGQVAAHIDVISEQRLPPGRTAVVPGLRQLSPLVADLAQDHHQIVRTTGDGVVMSVQATAETLVVPLVPTLAVFDRVFPNVDVATSDEGRFATQLVERLGGADSAIACEPAVRGVLNRVARSGQGLLIAELISRAANARGAWPGPFHRESARDYAERVVYRLLHAEILKPVVNVRCPHCSTESQLRPEDLTSKVPCPLCAEEFALGFALGLQRRKDSWRYALAGSIPPPRVQSALPMMATLSILRTAHRGGHASTIHSFGLALGHDKWKSEIDVALLIADGPVTVAVLIEVKGGNDQVNETDVRNLLRAQSILCDAGVDTLIGMATTRDCLSDAEVTLFRDVANNSPERHYRSSMGLALPVVLTGPDLSVPWADAEHPWRWAEPGGLPLNGLATKTCERNLGFLGFDYSMRRLRCRWSDHQQSAVPGDSDDTSTSPT